MRIVGLVGSLKKASCNAGLIRAAKAAAGKDVEFIIGNTDLPLFNQDIEADPPAAVKEFYKIVETADAIMIATPEHNFQMAASTKNFLDWGSRYYVNGAPTNIWNDKACAVMSAGGGAGGHLAQYCVRQSAVFFNMHMVNKPEVSVRIWSPENNFDLTTGDLINPKTGEFVKSLLDNLVEWTKRIKK